MDTATEPEQTDLDGHRVRITNHGKIQSWVTFALDFFEKNADKPLVMHTLPAVPSSSTTEQPSERLENSAQDTANKIATSTASIPRLISVVEIVKREYIKKSRANRPSNPSGLHQYNQFGTLEDLGMISNSAGPAEDAATSVTTALMGKNHPRQEQTPFMTVTLCRQPIEHLEAEGVTYQQPEKHKLSRNAKARARKREKKQQLRSEA